jgi:nucleoside-diphosphate-sugar epimerase
VPQHINGYDAVIHLACISNDPSFELNPKIAKEINLDAFRTFVDAAVAAKIPRFIYASSSSVYGICAEPADETHALEPLTDYSRYKVECEKMLIDSGLPYVIVRPATACGISPRMRFDTMLNSFVNQAMNTHSISVWGGQQMRSHIHIDDLVRFYLLALEHPYACDGIFNISKTSMSIFELAQQVCASVGECTIQFTTSDDKRSYQVAANFVKKELGFEPRITLLDAIDDIIAAMPSFTDPLNNPMYFNLKRMKEIYG